MKLLMILSLIYLEESLRQLDILDGDLKAKLKRQLQAKTEAAKHKSRQNSMKLLLRN